MFCRENKKADVDVSPKKGTIDVNKLYAKVILEIRR